MSSDVVYVYDIGKDQFTKFTGLDMRHTAIAVGVLERDNINLIVDSNSNITEFPGTELTEKDGVLETKRYLLLGQVIRRVSLEYEGGTPTLTVIAYNRRIPGGYVEYNISVSQSGRFYGIPLSYKCDYVQFRVTNANRIESIRYTTA